MSLQLKNSTTSTTHPTANLTSNSTTTTTHPTSATYVEMEKVANGSAQVYQENGKKWIKLI